MALLTASFTLYSQAFNTVLRDNLGYSQDLNDVWGYVAPDGTEYALVGTRTGLSIVSLADPDNISEVAFISGDASTWRDMKTYNEYAYVVADSGNDGLLIVDLSGLPASVTHQYYNVPVGGGNLTQSHNIYIDTDNGLAYLAGSNLNSGGMVILDVASTPGQAIHVANAPNTYSHDVYVQDDVMYASEIYEGEIRLYDVADINNISAIGAEVTPLDFTHNAWSNAAATHVWTTDEKANAPTAAYDITDPTNPTLVSEFFPPRSVNTGTIPHNVHVQDNYLIISHYTDGLEIVDASVPENPVEVAYYDTWSGGNGGFNGCWGAYPFLPSGLVLATDIDNGLYVVEVTYQRAARIKGTITEDDFSGPNLNNVLVSITNPDGTTTNTNASGFYQTGFVDAGNYTVTFSLPGYVDVVKSLDFVNGQEIVLDTFMTFDVGSSAQVNGAVYDEVNNVNLENGQVVLIGPDATYMDNSDASGLLDFGLVLEDQYSASSGLWSFENRQINIEINGPANIDFPLTPGYLDGFVVDQGWVATADASTTSGFWERAVPVGTLLNGNPSNPGNDAGGGTDIGDLAYVTGNGGGTAGADDVDGGNVTLTSPTIDFSSFPDPNIVVISYDYWFVTGGGNTPVNDNLTISITNGISTEVIATYTANTNSWVNVDYELNDLGIALTPNMQIIVQTGDLGGGHVVEAGFDDFRIYENAALPVELSAFTAQKIDNKRSLLNWITANEDGNVGFQIERATDGRNFQEIGFVSGAGNSRNENSYTFIDENPLPGINYYRLRQLDLDGKTAFSDVKSLTFGGMIKELSVFPNPANDFLQISGFESGSSIQLFNSSGKEIGSYTVDENGRINISQLRAGSYVIQVANKVARFTKQ